MWRFYGMLLAQLLLWLSWAVVHSEEPMAIAKILASPAPHLLGIVTLNGLAGSVRRLPPHLGRGNYKNTCVMDDAYVFTLEDQSASIEVFAEGTCRQGLPIPIRDGDRVTVQAYISVAGQYSRIRVEARTVRRVEALTK